MKMKSLLMACAIGGALALGTASAAAFAQPAKPTSFKAPRILGNVPDLGGVWSNVSITGLERRANFGDRLVHTPEEVAQLEGSAMNKVIYENQPTDPKIGAEDHTN